MRLCQCTQADRGLETLEDLLGEIEVELARIAEEEAPPLLEDEEGEEAAEEAAERRAAARLEALLARTHFSFDELRDNAFALATLGWQVTHRIPNSIFYKL